MGKKHERDYLYQKAGESTWYVKLTLPQDVRPALGNQVRRTRTTGTSNKAEARERSLAILAEWKREIELVREWKLNAGDEWRAEAAEIGERLASSRVSATQKIFTPDDNRPPANLDWFQSLPEIASELRSSGRPDLANRLGQYAQKLVDGLERGLTSGEGIDLANELSTLISEVDLAAVADEYHLSRTEQVEGLSIVRKPKAYKPRSPITKGMLDQWYEALAEQINTEKTRDMHRNRMQRLSDWLTSEGRALTFDSIHDFIKSVSAKRTTRQNYLWSGRTFWDWATKHHPAFREQFKGADNPFKEHSLPKAGAAAGESWIPFTKKEVERLHSKALEIGKKPLADLISIAAYTGCRLEEVGRINVSNTIFKGSEPIGFKIEDAKTEAGIREVPIHTAIAPLFKSLLETAKTREGYLLEGGKNKYGNRLDYLSKQFGRLKTTEGFDGLHVFHSIRKTTITELQRADIPGITIAAVVGHETGLITFDVYSAGPSFEQRQKAIQKLTFNFS